MGRFARKRFRSIPKVVAPTSLLLRVLVLSVTHGNPSLEEISLSDEQFWPIYPSLAEIPPVTDSTSDVCRDPSLMECTATRYCTVDLLWYQLQRSFSI